MLSWPLPLLQCFFCFPKRILSYENWQYFLSPPALVHWAQQPPQTKLSLPSIPTKSLSSPTASTLPNPAMGSQLTSQPPSSIGHSDHTLQQAGFFIWLHRRDFLYFQPAFLAFFFFFCTFAGSPTSVQSVNIGLLNGLVLSPSVFNKATRERLEK